MISGIERKKNCHLFSCWIFLPKVKETVARCTFVSISSRQPSLLMPECSSEHLHPFVLWVAFGEPLFSPSKLVCESALFCRHAQWNCEIFLLISNKNLSQRPASIKSDHRGLYLHLSYCTVEPSVDYSRTHPWGCWWDSAGIYEDLASQVAVKTLWSGETNTQPDRPIWNKLPLNFIIISVSCSAHYMNPVLHVFPPTFVRGGEPCGLIYPLCLPHPTENSSVTADSFSGKPLFH